MRKFLETKQSKDSCNAGKNVKTFHDWNELDRLTGCGEYLEQVLYFQDWEEGEAFKACQYLCGLHNFNTWNIKGVNETTWFWLGYAYLLSDQNLPLMNIDLVLQTTW